MDDEQEMALARFFKATNESYRRAYDVANKDAQFLKRKDSIAWAKWVHKTLNNERSSIFRSDMSLRLILAWSRKRLVFAACIPLALSFAIGMYLMIAKGDVSNAWTVSSYIITAGACKFLNSAASTLAYMCI